jgi:V/A-type H+-transporting ATPase subunit D
MAVALSKSSLNRRRDELRLFQRFLPSLELKRQQLTGEYKKATEALAEAEVRAARASRMLAAVLPFLASAGERLSGLVRVHRVELGEEDLLGLRLPTLRTVEFEVAKYSLLATPFWLDDAAACLQETATQRVRVGVLRARASLLAGAVRRVSQRVNLFDKVLIPGAERDIAHIRIFLSDVERAAVVTSKIAKAKRARERAAATDARRGR